MDEQRTIKIIKRFRNDGTYLVDAGGTTKIFTEDEVRSAGCVLGTHDGWHVAIYYNKKNKNGRTYLRDSVCNIEEIEEKIKNGQFLGELGHPQTDSVGFSSDLFSMVKLSNVSHTIVGIRSDSYGFYVNVKTLNTPSGLDMDRIPRGMIVFRPRSTGEIVDGVCININVIAFDAITLESDAFN